MRNKLGAFKWAATVLLLVVVLNSWLNNPLIWVVTHAQIIGRSIVGGALVLTLLRLAIWYALRGLRRNNPHLFSRND